jgi:hypothetical protein
VFYAALLSDGEVGNEANQLTVSDAVLNEPAEIPIGTVALFYPASFGCDTQNLTTVVTDSRGEGNHGIAGTSGKVGVKALSGISRRPCRPTLPRPLFLPVTPRAPSIR